jgi:hypothetical protein
MASDKKKPAGRDRSHLNMTQAGTFLGQGCEWTTYWRSSQLQNKQTNLISIQAGRLHQGLGLLIAPVNPVTGNFKFLLKISVCVMSDEDKDPLVQFRQAGWDDRDEETNTVPEDDSDEGPLARHFRYANAEPYEMVISGVINDGETVGSPVGNLLLSESDGEHDSVETPLTRHYRCANAEQREMVIWVASNNGETVGLPVGNLSLSESEEEQDPDDHDDEHFDMEVAIDDGEPAAPPLGNLTLGAHVLVTCPDLGQNRFHMGRVREIDILGGLVLIEWDDRNNQQTYVQSQFVSSPDNVLNIPRPTPNSPNRKARVRTESQK